MDQIEAYDNLIIPCVDSFKYITLFGLDCLSFVLIDHLADNKRDKLKPDGLNIEHWVQSLASFTGSVYRKYDGTHGAII